MSGESSSTAEGRDEDEVDDDCDRREGAGGRASETEGDWREGKRVEESVESVRIDAGLLENDRA